MLNQAIKRCEYVKNALVNSNHMSMKERYKKEVISELKSALKLSNEMKVPRIEKVVVNVGMGKHLKDAGMVEEIVKALAAVTGQRPAMTKSKKSIAGFKVREGQEIGAKVTLRGLRRWDFVEKLVGATLPRIRDFQGIKISAVDQNGNLHIGIREHLVFPEIVPENVRNIFSLEVSLVTSAKDRQEGVALFKALKFPLSQ